MHVIFRGRTYSIFLILDCTVMDDNDKGDHGKMLYTRLRLWQFPDKYILEPIDISSDSYLSISRADGSSSLIGLFPLIFFIVVLLDYFYNHI